MTTTMCSIPEVDGSGSAAASKSVGVGVSVGLGVGLEVGLLVGLAVGVLLGFLVAVAEGVAVRDAVAVELGAGVEPDLLSSSPQPPTASAPAATARPERNSRRERLASPLAASRVVEPTSERVTLFLRRFFTASLQGRSDRFRSKPTPIDHCDRGRYPADVTGS
jgi:hypothetical protein